MSASAPRFVLAACMSLPAWGMAFGQTPSFKIEWERVWGSSNHEEVRALCACPGGGYLLACRTNHLASTGGLLQLTRIADDGGVLWDRIYDPQENTLGSTIEAVDGGYLIAGRVTSSDGTTSRASLLKIGEDGTPIWDRVLVDADDGAAYSVRMTRDRGAIVAGIVFPPGSTGGDACLVKTDSEGRISWARSYGGPAHDYAFCACEMSDGGYAFAGQARSFQPVGSYDVYVGKTDADGELIWQKLFGGLESELAYDVEETQDGGLVVVGYTKSFSASLRYVYLIRVNPSGGLVWERTFGPEGGNYGFRVAERPDGGFMVAASTSGGGDSHYEWPYLILTDRDGNLLRERLFRGEFPLGNIMGARLTQDGGAVFVGGAWLDLELPLGFHIIRIVPDPSVPEPRFLRGDCNGDGRVAGEVSDAVHLLSYSFTGGKEPPCLAACDSNGDGMVAGQVADAVHLLTYSFLGGPAPPAPFPERGDAPLLSDIALGCGSGE